MGEEGTQEFSGRIGLIFAAIGAAIGTGNIWRFPRMVGANGGGSFLIPWLIFLFIWSVPLVIAEFAIGKRSRTSTVGSFRIFLGRRFAWMGLWTAWVNVAIGFYYAVVAGWCLRYFTYGLTGTLSTTDVAELQGVWNAFLQSPLQVVVFQTLIIVITLLAIWRGAKAIEKTNVIMMTSLFVLLFLALFLALYMDFQDGSLDGATFMFSIQPDYLLQPKTWINGLSQSAWSCSAGMGTLITYAVYMRRDEDTTLNAFTMGLANNSISIIAGVTVMSAIFAAAADPIAVVSGGSSSITFISLPSVFSVAPGGRIGALILISVFFLALTFAAVTSMISTVEMAVRNFADHGMERNKAVLSVCAAIFIFGLPSAVLAIKMDTSGVAYPEFLEVQDHIWGYGLMFSGLFIAFAIWRYGWTVWRSRVTEGSAEDSFSGWVTHGMPAFRDEFVNTGDNDLHIGRWWDFLMYFAFPLLFVVLLLSYFVDIIVNVDDPWNPTNADGIGIVLMFWGITAGLFMILNRYVLINRAIRTGGPGAYWSLLWFFTGNFRLEPRALVRNATRETGEDISTLPGGQDPYVICMGESIPSSDESDVETAHLLDADVDAISGRTSIG